MSTVGLVLSGGGALGAAHIGVWQELEKREMKPDFVVGVSAGSIIGALIACGYEADAAFEELKLHKIFSLVFDYSPSNFGILKGEKVKKHLDELFGGKRFDDLEMPFYVGTTDFKTGEQVIINSGLVSDAVRASISVPVLFEPFLHPDVNRWLVDGGLVQNFPLDFAQSHYDGDVIIGSDVCSNVDSSVDFEKKEWFKKHKHLSKTLFRTFRILFRSQQKHFQPDERVQIIQPDLEEFSSFDVFNLDKIVEQGRIAATSSLDN